MPSHGASTFYGRNEVNKVVATSTAAAATTATTATTAAAATSSNQEFSKLATFRTNDDDGRDSSDLLLSWNNKNLYFISTDISASENVKIVQTHEDLGRIEQLIMCRGDCVESGCGFFVLHKGETNSSLLLSRIFSMSPRTFLSSYHAEDTSLLKCIRIAVEHHVMEARILERLNSRLERSSILQSTEGENKDNGIKNQNDNQNDAALVPKFMEVLEAVRADVAHRRPSSPTLESKTTQQDVIQTERSLVVSVSPEILEISKAAEITQDTQKEENPPLTPRIVATSSETSILLAGDGDIATTRASAISNSEENNNSNHKNVSNSVVTVDVMVEAVLAMWSKNDTVGARRRYRVHAMSMSMSMSASTTTMSHDGDSMLSTAESTVTMMPVDIPDDVDTIEQLKEFFASLRAHLEQIEGTAKMEKKQVQPRSLNTTTDSVITNMNAHADNTSTQNSVPMSNDSWSTAGGTIVGHSYEETTIESTKGKEKKKKSASSSAANKKKKKKRKKRERLASLEDLDSTSFNVASTTVRSTAVSGAKLRHGSTGNLSNMAVNAMKRATNEATKVANILKEKTATLKTKTSLGSTPVTSPTLRPAKPEPIDVGEALQRLQPGGSVPWMNLRTAGVVVDEIESSAATAAASQIAADPQLKKLDDWLTKLRDEERSEEVPVGGGRGGDHSSQQSQQQSYLRPHQRRGGETVVESIPSAAGNYVGGAMDLIKQGLSRVLATTVVEKDVVDEEDQLPITAGIPRNLRGKRCVQVEYDMNGDSGKFVLYSAENWPAVSIECTVASSLPSYLPSSSRVLEFAAESYCRDSRVPNATQSNSLWLTSVYEHMCTLPTVNDATCDQYVREYRDAVVIERVMRATCRWRPSIVVSVALDLLPWEVYETQLVEALCTNGQADGAVIDEGSMWMLIRSANNIEVNRSCLVNHRQS
jgi:hypothetical protein